MSLSKSTLSAINSKAHAAVQRTLYPILKKIIVENIDAAVCDGVITESEALQQLALPDHWAGIDGIAWVPPWCSRPVPGDDVWPFPQKPNAS